ncbi:MAG: hypothetical protein AB7F65_09610 [Dehalococcoidia bacterium]
MSDAPEVYPRLLIITPGVLNRYRESGVTLTNLLAGWPEDRVTQIHGDPAPPPEIAADARFFDASGGARSSYRPLARRVSALGRFVRGQAETGLLFARMTADLERWLTAYPPDVILSQTGNLAFLRLTRKVQAFTGAPLVLYAADDWVSDWPANNLGRRVPPLTDFVARTVRREFSELVQGAVGLMAIGDAMGAEYHERFGGDWMTVPNPVYLDRWPARTPAARAYSAERPFRVLYSGSLSPLSQLPGVIEVATAVSSLHRAGIPIEFEVATHQGFQFLRGTIEQEGVRMVDLVPPESLPRRFAEVDLLLLPLVFDPLPLRYIRLSMPGKIAEYLASGTPVLVYGPRDTALVDHAADRGWAEVVPVRSVAAVAATLRGLMDAPDRREALASRAREVAEAGFAADRLVPAFQAALIGAASGRAR